ncbi:MAG: hypothetical protein J2P50_03420 [Hyphomicrobiaceae bacterium]|nr:hypothetical protein [Hyphomicrobiaceae bacterium]
MRKGFLVGVGAVLTLAGVSATAASACGGHRACGSYYGPTVGYSYAPVPPPAYGYLPGSAYGYGPGYGPPLTGGYGYAPAGYGFYGDAAYGGYRGWHGCDRGYRGYGYGYGYGGYRYAPPVGYDSYRPAAVWLPIR